MISLKSRLVLGDLQKSAATFVGSLTTSNCLVAGCLALRWETSGLMRANCLKVNGNPKKTNRRVYLIQPSLTELN